MVLYIPPEVRCTRKSGRDNEEVRPLLQWELVRSHSREVVLVSSQVVCRKTMEQKKGLSVLNDVYLRHLKLGQVGPNDVQRSGWTKLKLH
jgi:hypothetical protein